MRRFRPLRPLLWVVRGAGGKPPLIDREHLLAARMALTDSRGARQVVVHETIVTRTEHSGGAIVRTENDDDAVRRAQDEVRRQLPAGTDLVITSLKLDASNALDPSSAYRTRDHYTLLATPVTLRCKPVSGAKFQPQLERLLNEIEKLDTGRPLASLRWDLDGLRAEYAKSTPHYRDGDGSAPAGHDAVVDEEAREERERARRGDDH